MFLQRGASGIDRVPSNYTCNWLLEVNTPRAFDIATWQAGAL